MRARCGEDKGYLVRQLSPNHVLRYLGLEFNCVYRRW